MEAAPPRSTVVVVVDPECGDNLRGVIGKKPAWVTMSEANAPVVRAIWAESPNVSHLDGVTGFNHHADATAENRFLDQLDTIDLHHGPYSSSPPYTTLSVIGASPTDEVRAALGELGFEKVDLISDGFTARRTEAEARRMRD